MSGGRSSSSSSRERGRIASLEAHHVEKRGKKRRVGILGTGTLGFLVLIKPHSWFLFWDFGFL
jgi:hypothetical protein